MRWRFCVPRKPPPSPARYSPSMRVWVHCEGGVRLMRTSLQSDRLTGFHAVRWALKEESHYNRARITTLDWSIYPVLRFSEIPEIHVDLIQRLDEPPSVVGEIATIPAADAIANVIFDTTRKRMRTAPFTPERVQNCPNTSGDYGIVI